MAIPNLPWNVGIAHSEFATSGKVSNAAAAAKLPSNFKFSDFVGKSNIVINPFINNTYVEGCPSNGTGRDSAPGTFNGNAISRSIFSPNYKNSSGLYSATRDMGFRGSNVSHAQVLALGLDPSQVIVSPYQTFCNIKGDFDYYGFFGYLHFNVNNPFQGWVHKVTIDDEENKGWGWNSTDYVIPVPGPDDIILPAYYTDRGGRYFTLTVKGATEYINASYIDSYLIYMGYGYFWINAKGNVTVNGVTGTMSGSGSSTEAPYLAVTFPSAPGVTSFSLESLDGTKVFTFTKKKVILSSITDWSKGPPPTVINTYGYSDTIYVCSIDTSNGINNPVQTGYYIVK